MLICHNDEWVECTIDYVHKKTLKLEYLIRQLRQDLEKHKNEQRADPKPTETEDIEVKGDFIKDGVFRCPICQHDYDLTFEGRPADKPSPAPRWHKWPDEKPDEFGPYLVTNKTFKGNIINTVAEYQPGQTQHGWWFGDKGWVQVLYWRHLPLPPEDAA